MPDIIHPNPKSTKVSLWSMVHGPWSIIVYGLLSMVLFSCTTQKQLTYLQGIDEAGKDNFFPYSRPEYRLQKQDILYVDIKTQNVEINALLNPSGSIGISQLSMAPSGGGYLMGYTISDSGYISLPLIGNVRVIQKTLNEATILIEEKTSLMLKDASVVVKLLSYRITVLGEVKSPGSFNHFGNQLNVLDAIGIAGDLTEYGDRSNVLVIRPVNEGSITYRINLKDKNLLLSEAYFLLPNDIVIVEPRKVKLLSLNAQTISLFFSTIFSTISLTLLILNLNK